MVQKHLTKKIKTINMRKKKGLISTQKISSKPKSCEDDIKIDPQTRIRIGNWPLARTGPRIATGPKTSFIQVPILKNVMLFRLRNVGVKKIQVYNFFK